jgi:UDP-glucose 4-epimerase
MAVLVTGGAGYIGSVTTDLLRESGERAVVLDDLARGHRSAVDPATPFYKGRVGDRALVERIVAEHDVDCCVHFAALAYVGESVEDPARYYENNVGDGMALLGALLKAGVRRFVFSSTCATYGEPSEVPIPETHPQWPKNPYGWSKLMVERMLEDLDRAVGLRFVALRYFNAAGATATRGEHHVPETHLIPLVLDAAAGRRPHISVFGTDYPTPDGTAIRDYIHVSDLAAAHVLALAHLRRGGGSEFVNLGTGFGHSVKEVVDVAQRVTGCRIESKLEGRRAGDPARLVAQPGKAKTLLGWSPAYVDLEQTIRSAWEWKLAHPEGYLADRP